MTMNVNSVMGQTYATLPCFVLAVDIALDKLTCALGAAALLVAPVLLTFLPIVISGYVLIGIRVSYTPLTRPDSRQTDWLASVHLTVFGTVARLAIRWPRSFCSVDGRTEQQCGFHLTLASDRWLTRSICQRCYPGCSMTSGRRFPTSRVHPEAVLVYDLFMSEQERSFSSCVRRDERPRVRRLTWFFGVAAAFLAKLLGIPPIQWMAYCRYSVPPFHRLCRRLRARSRWPRGVRCQALVTQGAPPPLRMCRHRCCGNRRVDPLVRVVERIQSCAHAGDDGRNGSYFLELDRVLLVIGGIWRFCGGVAGAAQTG